MDKPEWPMIPIEISEKQYQLMSEGVLHQTHCVVTWIIADRDGTVLFKHQADTMINRSDDGTATMRFPDYLQALSAAHDPVIPQPRGIT